jgi:outer membrane receptor protein involved in Fe transport
LRGPQGTLYGRNATAGVVNLISAKPTDQFEAMASGEIGNYQQRRFEGMVNLPIVDDRLDIRLAGEWTKRQGYSFNSITDQRIDGRDLWSTRLSIGLKPMKDLQINFVWEHFQEDDDRLRSSKQLCATDKEPTSVNDVPVPPIGSASFFYGGAFDPSSYLSQGCKAASLYSPKSFEVPDGYSLPYVKAAKFSGQINPTLNPYAGTTQSRNLRVIESTVDPELSGAQRNSGTQRRLQRDAGTDTHVADSLQSGQLVLDGRLQSLQYIEWHIHSKLTDNVSCPAEYGQRRRSLLRPPNRLFGSHGRHRSFRGARVATEQ